MSDIVTAALLVIGDEILSGRTKDKNIGHVAEVLNEAGIRLEEVRVVADVAERIIAAVDALRGSYDYVFTTGGIGPTHDDITADAIARAFNLAIDVDPRALALMQPYYEARGMELTEARLRMARIPAGAELIDNPVSIAPGFMVANVIVLAGVPNIMQAMLAGVVPRLRKGRPMRSLTLDVRHPESAVAAPLRETQSHFPDVPMGSYPYVDDGRYCTNLVLRSPDPERLCDAAAALKRRLAAMGICPSNES
ncbi:MAG: competence/damage-inducible protein A [Rhizobiales bacterium]|nr:competence/damage-inducible protein A [Hyphomicrobiales bacterium]